MQQIDSATLEEWDRTTLWHAFSQMAEYDGLIIQSGRGNYLVDIDGREYLDGVSSMWCNVHGHAHAYINAAIQDQLHQIAHVSLLGMSNPTVITLSERLCRLAPAGLKHVFFASDGASAIEVAMKMAFQYWRQCESGSQEKNLFICVGGAYHGDTLGAVSVSGVARFRAMFHPLLFATLQGKAPVCNGMNREAPELLASALAEYEDLLARNEGKVAAIIVEPLVQAAAGIVFHPIGFLRGLRELADRHNVLLIADEVAVGFGKTGRMFACEHESVTPDFLCLGKGLSGGYLPISAVLTKPKVFEAFLGTYAESKSFFHGHTFGGNPLAAAAAHASLDLFHQEKTLEALPEKARMLQELLLQLQNDSHVASVRSLGLIGAFELVPDRRRSDTYPWAERRGALLCKEALRHGVWLRPLGNTIVIMPPLSITVDQLRQIFSAIQLSIAAATA